MTAPLNVAILGVGALGTLFGSRLKEHANVTLIGTWPAQIETLQQQGLSVTQPDGSETHHFLRVTADVADVPPADVALILVKSHQTKRAAAQAAALLRPDGIAITLQNGLGNLEQLAEFVGLERVVQGITAQGATVLAPGQLRHAGAGSTFLAQVPGCQRQIEAVAQLFNRAGLPTEVVDDATSLVWGKLAINAGINPLTALLELPNGALAEDEALRHLMMAAAEEVAQLARAQGIKLPYADAAQRTTEVSRATAANRSSMLQDMSRRAPTEIEAICGAVVRIGHELGLPTPVNRFFLEAIRSKEAGRVGSGLEGLQIGQSGPQETETWNL